MTNISSAIRKFNRFELKYLLTPKIEKFAALVTEYNAVENILEFVTQRYDFLSATELLGE